jgi:uncharacterized protein (TIGR00299 family) protein
MRIAYGDLIGGVSGDMFVGALLDVGLSKKELTAELKKIPTLRFQLEVAKKSVHGIRATRCRVLYRAEGSRRSWKDIRSLIQRSKLDRNVKEIGSEIFARLAAAEGKIHGVAPDKVHFHELGATDSVVDIMSAAIGVRALAIESFHFSRVPLGRGIVRAAHGPLPLPGPATLELLKGIPVEGVDVQGETVTPTGAAIVRVLGETFGDQPRMVVDKAGYGAGEKDWPNRPNVFRLVLGSGAATWKQEDMVVIETNIDDMNPEFYDYVFDRLFAAGARDVSLSPIQMKKNRPGTLLRVIAETRDREKLAGILFGETSTIGIRYYPISRLTLKRASGIVKTRYGKIRVKIIEEPDGTKRASPEYDDLKRIAASKNIPLKILHEEVARSLKR